jgi:hypothetical protein
VRTDPTTRTEPPMSFLFELAFDAVVFLIKKSIFK